MLALATEAQPLALDTTVPIPLLEVNGEPLLTHALRWLKQAGITDVVALLDRDHEPVRDIFDGDTVNNVQLTFISATSTIERIGLDRQLRALFDETFVIIGGRVLLDIDLADLLEYHRSRRALLTVALQHAAAPQHRTVVECDSVGRIQRWTAQVERWPSEQRTVNTGLYVAEPRVLEQLRTDQPLAWESEFLPLLVAQGEQIYGQLIDGNLVAVNTAAAYEMIKATGLTRDQTV